MTPSFIVGLLASGMSIKAILAEYDDLTRKDVLACLDFAAQAAEIVQSDMSNNRRKRR